MAGVIACGFCRAEAGIDGNAGGAKFGEALPGHLRIGVLDRGHDAGNPRGNDRVGAGRRFAEMRAGLERDIEGGAARGVTCALQGPRLGMRAPTRLGPAPPDNDAIFHHDRTDGRIGPRTAEPAPPERKRKLHETPVGVLRGLCLSGELIFQDTEDHLRIVASRVSSSSSPSTVSKSLASRKLR